MPVDPPPYVKILHIEDELQWVDAMSEMLQSRWVALLERYIPTLPAAASELCSNALRMAPPVVARVASSGLADLVFRILNEGERLSGHEAVIIDHMLSIDERSPKGFAVAQALHRNNPHVGILIVSYHAQWEDQRREAQLMADLSLSPFPFFQKTKLLRAITAHSGFEDRTAHDREEQERYQWEFIFRLCQLGGRKIESREFLSEYVLPRLKEVIVSIPGVSSTTHYEWFADGGLDVGAVLRTVTWSEMNLIKHRLARGAVNLDLSRSKTFKRATTKRDTGYAGRRLMPVEATGPDCINYSELKKKLKKLDPTFFSAFEQAVTQRRAELGSRDRPTRSSAPEAAE